MQLYRIKAVYIGWSKEVKRELESERERVKRRVLAREMHEVLRVQERGRKQRTGSSLPDDNLFVAVSTNEQVALGMPSH